MCVWSTPATNVMEHIMKDPSRKRRCDVVVLRRLKRVLTAQAEAEKIRKIGEAEAASIEAVGRAEAEKMRLKAAAYLQYGEAAQTALVLEALPKVTHARMHARTHTYTHARTLSHTHNTLHSSLHARVCSLCYLICSSSIHSFFHLHHTLSSLPTHTHTHTHTPDRSKGGRSSGQDQ